MIIELTKQEVELIQAALEHYYYATDGLTVQAEMQHTSEVQQLQDKLTKKGEN